MDVLFYSVRHVLGQGDHCYKWRWGLLMGAHCILWPYGFRSSLSNDHIAGARLTTTQKITFYFLLHSLKFLSLGKQMREEKWKEGRKKLRERQIETEIERQRILGEGWWEGQWMEKRKRWREKEEDAGEKKQGELTGSVIPKDVSLKKLDGLFLSTEARSSYEGLNLGQRSPRGISKVSTTRTTNSSVLLRHPFLQLFRPLSSFWENPRQKAPWPCRQTSLAEDRKVISHPLSHALPLSIRCIYGRQSNRTNGFIFCHK